MKIRALICVWLVALLGLAMCGATMPDIGLSSHRGKMNVGLKTAVGNGGGVAGWDTVVVLFSTEARSAIAGVDTIPKPSSGLVDHDNVRTRRLTDWIRGRNNRSWRGDGDDTGPAAMGDTAIVYRLGTGNTVSSFAWGNISNVNADSAGYSHAAGDRVELYCNASTTYLGTLGLNMNFPTASRKAAMFYIPFESYIPANSTIVSASVNVSLADNAYMTAATDTIIAQPMHQNWNQWWLVKGAGASTNQAHASWASQEDVKGGSWTGTKRNPWVPNLDYRQKLWDISTTSDWTGTDTLQYFTKQNLSIDITNCVQYFVNGGTNNGIMYNLLDSAEAVIQHFRWDTGTTPAGRTPYVVVKYITKRYQKPFGTAEWAFCFSTDDAKYKANASYDSVFTLHGGKYTIFATERLLNTATYCTDAQLMTMYSHGHEIGNHSSRHVPATGNGGGLLHYHLTSLNPNSPVPGQTNLAVGAATTGWDSLMIDCSPAWMYTMAAAQGYGDLTSDRRFAKAYALPNGGWSPEIFEALYRNGYTAIRGTGANTTLDRYRYYEGGPGSPAAPIGKARADTIWVDGPMTKSARWARNMTLMAISASSSQETGHSLFGPKTTPFSSAADIAKMKNNVKRKIFQIVGQNRRALITFTHNVKDSPPPGSGGYVDGVNANELDAALAMVDSLGGRYMGFAEYKDWIKAGSTGIATPAFATAPDTFQVQASEKIWCVPNGIDNRWIRRVR